MRKLLPNPGGQLDPDDVFGRDTLIRKLWRTLRRQSVVMTAERRMGKTSVIRKMMAGLPSGVAAVYQDLEQVHSADEFADLICRSVRPYLGNLKRATDVGHRVLQKLTDVNFGEGGISFDVQAPPWQVAVSEALADLDRQPGELFVFFWDEIPLMVDQIARRMGERQAIEVLDLLRALRHECRSLRMVYTGSIGLHHVVGRLKASGYTNEPTNDMYPLELPPLAAEDAKQLALSLLAGTEARAADPYAVAAAMTEETDGIAYLIHYVADLLRDDPRVDALAVRSAVVSALTAAEDPLNLHHYESRITDYYPPQDQAMVLAILDSLAICADPLKQSAVFNLVKSQVSTEDRERFRELLGLLCRDHYLHSNAAGYSFRFSIIRRYWCLHRGLGAE